MPAAQASQEHVAGIEVLVDGAPARLRSGATALIEVKVVDSLTLPDMALIRIADPKGENVDTHPLQLGKNIEIKASAIGDRATDDDLQGPDRGRRAGVRRQGLHDLRPRLRQVAQAQPRAQDPHVPADVGLGHGQQDRPARPACTAQVESTDVVFEFFQQSNETDWDFALAARADARLRGRRRRHQAGVPPGERAPAARRSALRWQDNLISFRPRMSRRPAGPDGQRPRLGSEGQEGRHGQRDQRLRRRRSRACSAARSPTTSAAARPTVTDRVAANNGEANAIAKSTLSRTADAFYEADGVAFGDPKIKAGTQGQDRGRRHRSSAASSWSPRRRTATAARPATRPRFQISGRSSRTLLELIRQPDDARLVRDPRGRRGDQQQRPGSSGSRAREVPLAVGQRGVGVGAGRHPERRQRSAAC